MVAQAWSAAAVAATPPPLEVIEVEVEEEGRREPDSAAPARVAARPRRVSETSSTTPEGIAVAQKMEKDKSRKAPVEPAPNSSMIQD